MSDDSKTLSRVEDILSGEDYIPTKPMSRIEKLLLEGGGPGGKLPEVTSDDNGKILKVKDGAWDKGEDISGDKLPQVSSKDNGKVLKVVQGEWNIDEDEGDRLPVVTSSDNGKILTVKNGAWDADDPEKELPETTSEDSGKALMVNDNGEWSKGDIPDTAITAEASGDITSFSDGSNLPMPKLQVGIEPVQDLHGYDNPWVGGSGKNKFDASLLSNVSKSMQYVTITLKANTQYTMSSNIPLQGGNTANLFFMLPSESAISSINGVYDEQSITTTTGADGQVKVGYRLGDNTKSQYASYHFQIEEGNQPTSYLPYSNICPISGHTEANVSDTSKNLVNWKWNTFNDGKMEIFLKGGTYTLSAESILTNGNAYICGTKPSGEYVSREELGLIDWGVSSTSGVYYGGGRQQTYTFNVPNGGAKIEFGKLNNNGTISAQLEFGSTATTYEPYNGQTYNIKFRDGDNPLTVYGGSLDVVSGELVVDRAFIKGGWEQYNSSNGYKAYRQATPTSKDMTQAVSKAMSNMISEYGSFSSSSMSRNIIQLPIQTPDLAYMALQEDLNANDVELSYLLATPITYQLTPTQVKSLLGSNNVWADCGEIESLIYYKQNAEDIADLIDTLAPDEKVKQTPTNDGVYDILLSGSTAGSAEATEGAKKSSTYPLKYSTHGNILMVGDSDSSSGGVDIGWTGVPNIGVGKTNSTTGAKNWIRMGMDDISFNANSSGTPETWDGVNTSLKAALAAAAGVGGCEAVYLPLADYEELTTAEKEDPTKIYFVINEGTKVSPTLSADDGNITTSSTDSGYDPWKAFDGSTRTDRNDYEYCYAPWGQHNGEWIAYNFGTKHVFSKVHIRAATTKAHTMNYYIEGSEDGETWTGLIFNADYVSVSHPEWADTPSFVETDILLDTSKGKFSKIRFRQDLSIGYPYSGDRFIVANWDIYAAAASNKPSIYYKNTLYTPDELPVTTISDAGKVLKVNEDGLWDKGDAYVELTQAEYDALPSSKESDGIIYFING